MYRFIKIFVQTLKDELLQWIEDIFHLQDPLNQMENQLRILYARGEISRDRYVQMRYRLYYGNILPSEIAQLHREALNKDRGPDSLWLAPRRPEVNRSLDHLYLDLALLEEGFAEINERQAALMKESTWLKEQAAISRQNAEAALPDENEARRLLEIWQHLSEISGDLDRRQVSLQQQRASLQALEVELKASIARLKLLDSQENLTSLQLRTRQDLLIQGQKINK